MSYTSVAFHYLLSTLLFARLDLRSRLNDYALNRTFRLSAQSGRYGKSEVLWYRHSR